MAIIDLRHLIAPECDTVEFVGSIDKLEYKIPLRQTVGMSIMLNQYFMDYNKSKNIDTPDWEANLELNYMLVTSWIRGYYPEICLEWVKNNVSNDLFKELVKLLEPLFFPKQTATVQPRKGRKSRVS
jgi:hypothetical protein